MKINGSGESEKTNPIQTQSNPIAERVILMQSVYLQRIMNKNADKGYEKTNPISEMAKMNANIFITKDYENEPPSGPEKTNPIKACPERSRMGQIPNTFSANGPPR
jgi:hypothetical protein